MRIHLPEGETREISSERMKIEDLLQNLGINPLEVLIVRNGRVVPEDEYVQEEDEIRVISVKSGG